jgi:hypothetical protein
VLLIGGLSACGSADVRATANALPTAAPSIKSLPGAQVGEMAEKELEAEHHDMAVGTVTCPDLVWQLDASVRCMKTSELSDGRRLKIPGTVTVTSTQGWGRLHVELDNDVSEFGIAGAEVAKHVTAWVQRRVHVARPQVRCPYLRGATGVVERCAVTVAGKTGSVRVRVSAVDANRYLTKFACSWQVRPSSVAGAKRQ